MTSSSQPPEHTRCRSLQSPPLSPTAILADLSRDLAPIPESEEVGYYLPFFNACLQEGNLALAYDILKKGIVPDRTSFMAALGIQNLDQQEHLQLIQALAKKTLFDPAILEWAERNKPPAFAKTLSLVWKSST